jgi:putative transport protein
VHWLKTLLKDTPEIALFLCLAAGFAIGKIKVWKLSLGGIAGTLIVSIFVGELGEVTLDGQVKNIAFALFIFTLGYMSGPSFFASLNRNSLRYGVFTLIEVGTVLAVTAVAILLLNLDVGTAAGLMGGGATESAVVGTATDAIAKLPRSAAQIKTLQANVGTAYSISYICGLITVVLLTSQLAPAVMGIDLRAEAAALWRKLGGAADSEGTMAALPAIVGRAQRVSTGAGRTVCEIESAIGAKATVERLSRDGTSIAFEPGTTVRQGDLLVIVGPREELILADDVVGPEAPGSDGLNLDLDIADVLVTRKDLTGETIERLRAEIPADAQHGVFLTGVTRSDKKLPMQPGTTVNAGDVVRLTGAERDVASFTAKIGFRVDTAIKADFVYIALGMVVGFLIGKISVRLGDVPMSLGTGGGCLLSGLAFGWLRAKRPTFGQYDSAAAAVIKDLGLAVFICAVGLSSGPQAVSLIQKYGVSLPIFGILMTLLPACISLFVGWKVMKLPAPLTLGAVAGQQCSTPAITAIQSAAGNATPLMSYTIVYALSNVVLPLLGPVVVAMAKALGG